MWLPSGRNLLLVRRFAPGIVSLLDVIITRPAPGACLSKTLRLACLET
jgi:hypothetical protein